MKNGVRKQMLRQILVKRVLALSAVTIFILGGVMMVLLYLSAYQSSSKEAVAAVETAGLNVSMLSDSLNNISSMVSYSPVTQNALSTYKKNGEWHEKSGLYTLFSSTVQYIRLIDNLVLLNNDYGYFSSMFVIPEQQKQTLCSFVEQLPSEKKDGRVSWYILGDTSEPQALLMRAIYDTSSPSLDFIGYLVITLNLRSLYEMAKSYQFRDSSELLLTDADGNILYAGMGTTAGGDISSIFGTEDNYSYCKVGGTAVLAARSGVLRNGWKLVELTPQRTLFITLWYWFSWIVLLLCVVTLLFSVALALISRSIVAPFQKMQQAMQQIEVGNFNVPTIPAIGIVEIDDLLLHFEEMAETLNDTIEEVYYAKLRESELTVQAQQSEIEMLQQQINPHFLYNTLDSINWMASMGATEEVSHMIVALSNFFRFTVNEHSVFTTIDRESDFAKNYIYLQKRRFGSTLSVEFDIMSGLGDYLTLRLLLQPLIENAIIHGTMRGGKNALIRIKIALSDNMINLTVQDNGIGMKQETITQILSHESKTSIGLPNILRRLELAFKGKYSFEIQSVPMEGTCIHISFPAVKSESELSALPKKS